MSIQLRVHYFKDDEEVHRSTIPGGYTYITRTDEQLIQDVLDEQETLKGWLAKYKKPPMPEWDKFWIMVGKRVVEYKA